jgi:retron-type reverse transcriptase
MIEEVLHLLNLMRVCRQVVSNKGSVGVDEKSVEELEVTFRAKHRELETSLRESSYVPEAVLEVEIPKACGKTRQLGIPTVLDRLLQQVVFQVLNTHYDANFEESSYGFRPRRNARQAVKRSLSYINR